MNTKFGVKNSEILYFHHVRTLNALYFILFPVLVSVFKLFSSHLCFFLSCSRGSDFLSFAGALFPNVLLWLATGHFLKSVFVYLSYFWSFRSPSLVLKWPNKGIWSWKLTFFFFGLPIAQPLLESVFEATQTVVEPSLIYKESSDLEAL